jgi:hypothetical protein
MKLRQKRTSQKQTWIRRNTFDIILLMSMLSFQEAFGRQIEFVSEEIELLVGDSTCTVIGSYWFRDVDSVTVKNVLFYPFVVNKQLPYPDTIVVTDMSSDRQVHWTRGKSGIFFGISIHAFETALYRVSYTQKTYARSMEYLLLTTAKWKKPLEQALYRVRIPDKYVLMSSTIIFPQTYKKDTERVFETCEEHFMPSKDFIIQWEGKLP